MRSDEAAKAEEAARVALLQKAQEEAHKTEMALAAAAISRPVSVARATIGNANAAIDQAIGSVSAEKAAELRKLVDGLLSDNEVIRAAALKQQNASDAELASISTKLEKAEAESARKDAELATAQKDLRVAFDRENALANSLRGYRFMFIGAAVLALLGSVIAIYLRMQLGGVGRALASFSGSPVQSSVISKIDEELSALGKRFIWKGRTTAERAIVKPAVNPTGS